MSPSGSASRRGGEEREGRLAEMRWRQQATERQRLTDLGTATIVVLPIAGAVTFTILRDQPNKPYWPESRRSRSTKGRWARRSP